MANEKLNPTISELNEIYKYYCLNKSAQINLNSIPKKMSSEKDLALINMKNAIEKKRGNEFSKLRKPELKSTFSITPPKIYNEGSLPSAKMLLPAFVCIAGLLFILSVLFLLLSYWVNVGGYLIGIINAIVFFGCGGFWCAKHNEIDEYVQCNDSLKKWIKKAKNSTFEDDDKFIEMCKEYARDYSAALSTLKDFADSEQKKYKKSISEIEKSYEKEKQELSTKLRDLDEKLDSFTLINPSLFYIAGNIADALDMGRADSLKEAINIALEDERKDKEEAARREEALRQEEILERQAEDNRIHNAIMQEAERQARYTQEQHNRAMEAAALRQAEETAKLRSDLNKMQQNKR